MQFVTLLKVINLTSFHQLILVSNLAFLVLTLHLFICLHSLVNLQFVEQVLLSEFLGVKVDNSWCFFEFPYQNFAFNYFKSVLIIGVGSSFKQGLDIF